MSDKDRALTIVLTMLSEAQEKVEDIATDIDYRNASYYAQIIETIKEAVDHVIVVRGLK